ncbi:MAG: hypothetical protein LBS74_02750 [Oscillospiraceae bacterium]|nr:hypothetical protein [Oscillospiraceae bacterium]
MADKYTSGERFKEAVCIDANRIYDSCSDKDCIENLPVQFTDCTQGIIDRASIVRTKKVECINCLVDLEPIPFNRGYYSVDMTFYFDVELEVGASRCGSSALVHGLSVFNKKVILYGSEGGVKVFSSDFVDGKCDLQNPISKNLPKAVVQVANPVSLDARLVEKRHHPKCCCCNVPKGIRGYFDGEFLEEDGEKLVFITIGLFSIVQIERNVSMLVHAYDFCVPSKQCTDNAEDPCALFSKIKFPVEEFFPPRAGEIPCTGKELEADKYKSCGCK